MPIKHSRENRIFWARITTYTYVFIAFAILLSLSIMNVGKAEEFQIGGAKLMLWGLIALIAVFPVHFISCRLYLGKESPLCLAK